MVGLLGPLVQRGGWVWAAFCVPPGLALLYLGVFRIPRTGTIDLDHAGMHVRGVFTDHRVTWEEIAGFDVVSRSANAEGFVITGFRPTVFLANGKSFWIYGFTPINDDREARATVSRLSNERSKYLRESAGR
jgi:hypothetical protein